MRHSVELPNNPSAINAKGEKPKPWATCIPVAAGRPDLVPTPPITVQGFKPEIDAEAWIVAKVSHSVSDGGYVCGLDLEALLQLE